MATLKKKKGHKGITGQTLFTGVCVCVFFLSIVQNQNFHQPHQRKKKHSETILEKIHWKGIFFYPSWTQFILTVGGGDGGRC